MDRRSCQRKPIGVKEARELALEALGRGDRGRARKLLKQAIAMVEGEGDLVTEGECRLALGLTYLRVGGEEARRTAFEELARAARCAALAGAESLFLKCLTYMVEAVSSDHDIEALRALVAEASMKLSEAGKAEAERAVGVAATFLEISNKGVDLSVWEKLNDQGVVSELLDRGLLPPGYWHVFAAGQAEARGDLCEAEREALAGRQAALEATDPFLYVLSCGAVASIRDKRGDRVGALTILFTCRASIEDLLGPEAASQVDLMIDALRARWGEEAFAEVLAEYRRQFE